MSTAVNEVKISDFTDESGKFHVGMTKEDASKLKNSIFHDYQQEFEEADKDGNEVLDADEMLKKIWKNAEDKKKESKTSFYWFLFWGPASKILYRTKSAKNSALAGAIIIGVMSLFQTLKTRKLEHRAMELKKLINQMPAEEPAQQV